MIEEIIYDLNLKKILKYEEKMPNTKFIEPIWFDTQEFHEYHNKFADKIYKIYISKDEKELGYFYVGIKSNIMKAPYSSPFSILYPTNKCRIDKINDIIKGIIECTNILNYKEIIISLPPEIYLPEIINAEWAALSSNGFVVNKIDINNYFNLSKFKSRELFLKKLNCRARQNYNRGLKNGLTFSEISNENFQLAYDVIRINKKELGYPLKISETHMDDLIHMKGLVCRCFGVKKENKYIATAIVFDTSKDISQIIYWGDITEYRKIRPMNILSINILEYYKNLGKKYLDLGPSSEDGVINTGLADFKKSIGCDNNIKITFKYEF